MDLRIAQIQVRNCDLQVSPKAIKWNAVVLQVGDPRPLFTLPMVYIKSQGPGPNRFLLNGRYRNQFEVDPDVLARIFEGVQETPQWKQFLKASGG